MTIEIYYHVNGEYTIIDGPATLGHAETYHEAAEIEASYLEAKHSATMGGDPLLIEAGQVAERGREQTDVCVSCGDQLHNDAPALSICDACRIAADMWQHDNTPLLAQCAALLDNLLGGPVIGGGIMNELRRVRAALAEQGW